MPYSTDPLTRAIELSIEFAETKTAADADAFLREHEHLREILEPLIRQDAIAAEPDADARPVLGDFELVRELGRGGMGVVYEAIQTLLGRTVALKLLPPHRALSPRSLAMFRREATLAASLRHPGIARVLEFQEIDGQLALAMELIDGLPLDDVLESLQESVRATAGSTATSTPTSGDLARAAGISVGEVTLPGGWRDSYEATAIELMRQVAEALAHAHSRGVVHRDVKPGNILITPDGRAVLTDFGLAREEGMGGMTRTGEFAGTYHYAAPEQLEGLLDQIDGRTDVYALGATLYELLTLRRPIQADSLTEIIRRIQREDPTPPSRINPDVSPDLEAVVMCALEKDRHRRYASADEFAVDLAHVLDGTPVKARRLSASALATRWVRRNRLVTAFVAVLVVSTVAIAIFAANAARAEKKVTHQLQRYENIWVGAALDAVIARADRAHPAWPSKFAELRELVRICEVDLLGMRTAQQAALDELRDGNMREAEPGQLAVRAPTRPPHPARARITELRATIRRLTVEAAAADVSPDARQAAEEEYARMQVEIGALEQLLDASNRVQIDDPKRSALHDRLETQLFRLRQLEETLYPDLQVRRDWAEEVAIQARSAADAWHAAADRVAADERFGGRKLAPQFGLVPLGRDPRSGLEEFVHLLSSETASIPARSANGKLPLAESDGIVFVLLPGGRFTRRDIDVRLDPFFVAKHEMSRAQWQRLARNLPGLRWRDGGIADVRNHGELDKPVNGVTWDMCSRLLTRCGLDLPTATQWEYAAVFGGGVPPSDLGRVANLRDQSYARGMAAMGKQPPPCLRFDDGHFGLAPILSMEPTPAGLHQLHGNVGEWCRDVYLPSLTAPRDGDGLREQEAPEFALRVICGGNWQTTSPLLMFDRRSSSSAARSTGLRPVRRWIGEDDQ